MESRAVFFAIVGASNCASSSSSGRGEMPTRFKFARNVLYVQLIVPALCRCSQIASTEYPPRIASSISARRAKMKVRCWRSAFTVACSCSRSEAAAFFGTVYKVNDSSPQIDPDGLEVAHLNRTPEDLAPSLVQY